MGRPSLPVRPVLTSKIVNWGRSWVPPGSLACSRACFLRECRDGSRPSDWSDRLHLVVGVRAYSAALRSAGELALDPFPCRISAR
jgi:hypothetical protein